MIFICILKNSFAMQIYYLDYTCTCNITPNFYFHIFIFDSPSSWHFSL